jgi:hypothetical protein
MDSEPDSDDHGMWDFRAVRKLRRAFNHPQLKPGDLRTLDVSVPDTSRFDPKCEVPKSLGDLDRLLSFCGKSISIQSDCHDAADSSSQHTDYSTPPTSAVEDNILYKAESFEDFIGRSTAKTVQWKDEVGEQDQELAEFRRRSVQDSAAHLDSAIVAQLLDLSAESDTESDGIGTPTPKSKLSRKRKSRSRKPLKSTFHSSTPLLPHCVPPVRTLYNPSERPPPPIQHLYSDPNIVAPIYTLTNNEQKAKLIKKLSTRFGISAKEDYGQAIKLLGGPVVSSGIHVSFDHRIIHR